jgi:hypothetical protein
VVHGQADLDVAICVHVDARMYFERQYYFRDVVTELSDAIHVSKYRVYAVGWSELHDF